MLRLPGRFTAKATYPISSHSSNDTIRVYLTDSVISPISNKNIADPINF